MLKIIVIHSYIMQQSFENNNTSFYQLRTAIVFAENPASKSVEQGFHTSGRYDTLLNYSKKMMQESQDTLHT